MQRKGANTHVLAIPSTFGQALGVGNNSLALTNFDRIWSVFCWWVLFWFRRVAQYWPDHHCSAELFSIEATATSPTVTKLVNLHGFLFHGSKLLHTAHTVRAALHDNSSRGCATHADAIDLAEQTKHVTALVCIVLTTSGV